MKRFIGILLILLSFVIQAPAQYQNLIVGVTGSNESGSNRSQLYLAGNLRLTEYLADYPVKLVVDSNIGFGDTHQTRFDGLARVFFKPSEEGIFAEGGLRLNRTVTTSLSFNRLRPNIGAGYVWKQRLLGKLNYASQPEAAVEFYQRFSGVLLFKAGAKASYVNQGLRASLTFGVGLNLDAVSSY